MKQLALYHPTTRSLVFKTGSKRLIAHHTARVQVKIMLEGCFVMPYLSVPQNMVESMRVCVSLLFC